MKFEQNLSMIFSDIELPEFFISEYFCEAPSDYIKLYIYCLFLKKHDSEISALDLSKKLSIPITSVEQGFKYWEERGILIKKNKNYELFDLKKVAVNKLYTPKLTSSLETAIQDTNNNVRRTKAIKDINTSFFQGVMSPTWYSLIDNLFTKYSFDEDVMIALFRYCFDRQKLFNNYLSTVAEGWHNCNIKTMNDLERYYLEADQTNKIKKSISKKLGLNRNLSEYEEAYIEKWTKEYNYPMEILEIALKKTTSKSNFNFDYLDKIITDWHDKNLISSEEINEYLKQQKAKYKEAKLLKESVANGQVPLHKYFDDTDQYSDETKFYVNL